MTKTKRGTIVGAEHTAAGPRLTLAIAADDLQALLRDGRFGRPLELREESSAPPTLRELLDATSGVLESFSAYRQSREPYSASASVEGVGEAYAALHRAIGALADARRCYAGGEAESQTRRA